jgi:hypothetical protein
MLIPCDLCLLEGMDLNPVFTSHTAFRPSGSMWGGGELKLFEHVGIPLVHGWVIDPASTDADVLERVNDYDAAVDLIVEVDHLTNGKFVMNEIDGVSPAGPSSPTENLTEEKVEKVADGMWFRILTKMSAYCRGIAIVIRRFLDDTQSQLTYHGLFQLATSLPPNTLCALFRNSHLSVIYKYVPSPTTSNPTPTTDPDDTKVPSTSDSAEPPSELLQPQPGTNAALYSLVTDQVFLREPFVVWEKLEDVDGGWSMFVDSDFVKSSPAGGDFAGQTAEEALRAMETEGQLADQFNE